MFDSLEFKYPTLIAQDFYLQALTPDECLSLFYSDFDKHCKERGITYTKEETITPNGKILKLVLEPNLGNINIHLNDNGEPKMVNVVAYSSSYLNELKDIMRDTQKFFKLPIHSVSFHPSTQAIMYVRITERSLMGALLQMDREDTASDCVMFNALSLYRKLSALHSDDDE